MPNLAKLAGRNVNAVIATRTSDVAAQMKKLRLIATSPLRSLSRSLVVRMPTTELTMPIAPMASGSSMPLAPKTAWPRISAATRVTAYDSNRSAAMPAQSPTLSPTLSAIVAALRASSSGIPASTLPTRSAPTSAALVKMPPPTRMNIARSAPPKAKPSSTVGACWLKMSSTTLAPSRPRPTVSMPTIPPVRYAMRNPRLRPEPPPRAAAATRTLARVAIVMPT